MAKEPMVLAGEQFVSKDAIRKRVKAILDATSVGNTVSSDKDFLLIYALLEWHSRAAVKIGAGVSSFVVQMGLYGRGRSFVIRRVDGTETDFSYIKCLYRAPHQNLKRALRNAVDAQVREVRNETFNGGNTFVCSVTGKATSVHDAHVDHEPPMTFVRLMSDFFAAERIDDLDAVKIGGGRDGELEKWLEDRDLEKRWIAFHRKHARLRVVSSHANCSVIPRIASKYKETE